MVGFIRTLRHTGCKATVVFFVDTRAYSQLSSDHLHQMENCGMIMINVGVITNIGDLCFPYVPMADFLYKNQLLINRVILVDGFDSAFQGDPFTKYFIHGKMYFTSEHITFRSSRLWRQRLYRQYGVKMNRNSLVINSGQIYGDTHTFLHFLDIFFRWYNYSSFANTMREEHDQTLINFLIYHGELDNEGLDYVIDEVNNSFACNVLWVRFKKNTSPIWGNILSSDNQTIGLGIHYFWDYETIRQSLKQLCPQGKYQVQDFIREKKEYKSEMIRVTGRKIKKKA
jgi:hypothetical protein